MAKTDFKTSSGDAFTQAENANITKRILREAPNTSQSVFAILYSEKRPTNMELFENGFKFTIDRQFLLHQRGENYTNTQLEGAISPYGGMVDAGEGIKDAMIRELTEEIAGANSGFNRIQYARVEKAIKKALSEETVKYIGSDLFNPNHTYSGEKDWKQCLTHFMAVKVSPQLLQKFHAIAGKTAAKKEETELSKALLLDQGAFVGLTAMGNGTPLENRAYQKLLNTFGIKINKVEIDGGVVYTQPQFDGIHSLLLPVLIAMGDKAIATSQPGSRPAPK